MYVLNLIVIIRECAFFHIIFSLFISFVCPFANYFLQWLIFGNECEFSKISFNYTRNH